MKKFLILVFCISVVTFAFASGTRVASFGEISYGDAVEIGVYPGLRTHFTNYFSTTMKTQGDDNNYSGGIAMDLGSGVFAVDLNKQSSWFNLDSDNLKTIGLTYGMKISGYDVGANFTYGSDVYFEEEGSDEYTEKSKYLGFGLGVSNDMFDFGIKYGLPNYEETDSDTLANGDPIPDYTYGGSSLELHARYLPLELGGFKIIPEVGFGTSSTANQDDDVTSSSTQYDFNTIIGYDISKATKVIFDVQLFGLNIETIDYADTLINMVIDKEKITTVGPLGTWKIGVESEIKSWLIGRLGAVKEYNKWTETTIYWEGDDYNETWFFENFKLTFGLAFKFNKFTIDVNFNEELLFTGPNFISGAQQDWASAISMKYLF